MTKLTYSDADPEMDRQPRASVFPDSGADWYLPSCIFTEISVWG